MITLTLTPGQAEALHTFLYVASLSPSHLGPHTSICQLEAQLAPIAQQLNEQLPLLTPVA